MLKVKFEAKENLEKKLVNISLVLWQAEIAKGLKAIKKFTFSPREFIYSV